jgi:hypothetical protein
MKVIAEGLFYHPRGNNVLDRLVDGTVNPRLDNPFAPALDEAQAERDRVNEQVRRAGERLRLLRNELKRAEAKLEAQEKAQAHYAETGEIDPILVPSCEALAMAEVAAQDKKVKEDIGFELPTELLEGGWLKKSVRVTEHEILVTIRKIRTDTHTNIEDKAEAIAEKVKIAMMPFQVDDARYRRVLRDRIASRPQQPKGPPDD